MCHDFGITSMFTSQMCLYMSDMQWCCRKVTVFQWCLFSFVYFYILSWYQPNSSLPAELPVSTEISNLCYVQLRYLLLCAAAIIMKTISKWDFKNTLGHFWEQCWVTFLVLHFPWSSRILGSCVPQSNLDSCVTQNLPMFQASQTDGW